MKEPTRIARALLTFYASRLVAKRDADGPVRVVQDVGAQRPLYCTALGKVLAADLPSRALMGTLARQGLTWFTRGTIVQRSRIEQELKRVRQQGYATDDGEFVEEVAASRLP